MNHTRGSRPELMQVLRLGCLNPRFEPDPAVVAILSRLGNDAAVLLKRHRVVLMAQHRLQELGFRPEDAPAFARGFSSVLGRLTKRTPGLRRTETMLTVAAAELSIPIFGMKGLAARAAYPRPELRDVRDADVWVPDERAGWHLAGWLQDQGYAIDRRELPWFKAEPGSGRLYGQIKLRPAERPLLDVDIHFGRYSVGHAGGIEVPTLDDSPGWRLLPVDANLGPMLGNAVGDSFVTVKDCNDIVAALSILGRASWEAFLGRVERAGLPSELAGILARTSDLQSLDDGSRQRVSDYLARARPKMLSPLTGPTWRSRCRSAVLGGWHEGRHRGVSHAIRLAATAYRYYRRPLMLTSGFTWDRVTLSSVNNWTCIRLVPPDLAWQTLKQRDSGKAEPPGPSVRLAPISAARPVCGSSVIQRLPTSVGDLCIVSNHVYVPTVYYRLPPALVAAADHAESQLQAASCRGTVDQG